MNRSYFLARVKQSVFAGRLSATQQDGLTRILDYRSGFFPRMSDEAFAYLLATVTWETGRAMRPVREAGGEKYLKSKPYYPWVGEGLVQVTWERNARKFGAEKPGDCMTWPVALRAAFEGMTKGMFTGKKLDDYITDEKCDFVGARRIINGTDKAALIAGIADAYLDAIRQASAPPAAVVSALADGADQSTGKPLVKSKTAISAIVAGASGVIPAASDAIYQAQQAVEAGKSAMDLATSVGPWVLLVLVIVVAVGVIIWERHRKAVDLGV